jgi:hypothetical protein
VRLALGKRVPATSETGKAVAAHTAAAMAGGGGSSQAPAAVAEFICGHQIERRTESEDEGENHASDPVRAGELPPAVSRIQPAPPELQEAVARHRRKCQTHSPKVRASPPSRRPRLRGEGERTEQPGGLPGRPGRPEADRRLPAQAAEQAARHLRWPGHLEKRECSAQCLGARGDTSQTTVQRFWT